MKKIYHVLINLSVFGVLPGIAGAAGTYYNGNLYQNPQSRYGAGNGGYYNTYGAGRYAGLGNTKTTRTTVSKTTKKKSAANRAAKKQGFNMNVNFTHEFADWGFDMKNAGSKLHYDNLSWNVLSADGKYYFGDTTPVQISVGARYGMQFDKSPMIDDDISNGGYIVQAWGNNSGTGTNSTVIYGYQTGHALSVGTSDGGKQMGFNAALGLTDFFNMGSVKITPSIGYRWLKYELSTKKNYGVTIDIFDATENHNYITCIEGYGGEIQCDPILLFYSGNSVPSITGRLYDDNDELGNIVIPSGATSVDTAGTYYYEQSGTSHKYKTQWAGPYIALDMEYNINNDNLFYGGIELGLPIYNAKGDQPYRYDWAHPTSVEDEGDFGDAIHIGLNANWSTRISDAMSFNLGFTYDYYKVSDATANTYLNSNYYVNLYNVYYDKYTNDATLTAAQKAALEDQMAEIEGYERDGWTLKEDNEIESVYKAMGIRAGINIKF